MGPLWDGKWGQEHVFLVAARELAGSRRSRGVGKAFLVDSETKEIAHALVDEDSEVGDRAVESSDAIVCAGGAAVDFLGDPLCGANDLALIGVLFVERLETSLNAVETNQHDRGKVADV